MPLSLPGPHWLLVDVLVVPHFTFVLPVLYSHMVSIFHSLLHRFDLSFVDSDVIKLSVCIYK